MLKYSICVILLVAVLERRVQADVSIGGQIPEEDVKGMKPNAPAPPSEGDPTHPGGQKGHRYLGVQGGPGSIPGQIPEEEIKGMKPNAPAPPSEGDPTHPGGQKGHRYQEVQGGPGSIPGQIPEEEIKGMKPNAPAPPEGGDPSKYILLYLLIDLSLNINLHFYKNKENTFQHLGIIGIGLSWAMLAAASDRINKSI
ncbi:translation initiation factor IF-2-like isoform X2 [Leptidea sinapis]|uniref:translation initiation factor IF-2-like isoform X2 n=1 Tax=Leptidea sinapis TaxID=189913 RepID=UPI00212A0EE3|nr:translation initiation factor IF-2-like isoform X2 [Leptidea sinapis]